MPKKVIYNPKKCTACHACNVLYHNAWEMSKFNGKAVLIDGQLKKDVYFRWLFENELELMQKVAKACKAKAIIIT